MCYTIGFTVEILELEQKYSELKSALSELNSKRNKLLLIADYFSFINPNDNANILEAYFVEFIPDFLSYIKSLEIRGLNPEVLLKLQAQLKTLRELNFANVSKDDLSSSSYALDEKLKVMGKWLNNGPLNKSDSKIYFPVLEKKESGFGNGYLESLNVEIKNGEQKFYITPSEYEGDEQLEKQVTLCFSTAINYCKKFIRKIKPTHTIYLHFEDKLGMYSGNSLGIALTLIFIETILKHYNSATVININSCIAVTGGIDQNSKIISTSKTIIEIKLETVFFSDTQIFCVPKVDEMWAEEKLKELKTKYPNRDLKIIGLSDLEDLLSRRNVVDIRKQKLIVRSGKFVKKNWISAVATVLLAILFGYLIVMDWDENPDTFYSDGNNIYVLNKKGRNLWSYNCFIEKYVYTNQDAMKYYIKFKDIDDDGINEIFYVQPEINNTHNRTDQAMLIGLKNLNDTLWTYTFRDSVSSEREILSNNYSLSIIDFIDLNDKNLIVCWAQNTTSFANAVFLIDTKTGKRINKTHWVSGHITGGMILDLNQDRREDLLLTGIDNGYEEAVIWGVEIDQLDGYRPTIQSYVINVDSG